MKGTIGFENLRINCIIGELAEERMKAQEILLSLEVEADFSRVAKTDDVHDTLNYVLLANFCHQVAVEGQFKMLETLASTLLHKLLAEFSVISAQVVIKKPGSVPNADFAYVQLGAKA